MDPKAYQDHVSHTNHMTSSSLALETANLVHVFWRSLCSCGIGIHSYWGERHMRPNSSRKKRWTVQNFMQRLRFSISKERSSGTHRLVQGLWYRPFNTRSAGDKLWSANININCKGPERHAISLTRCIALFNTRRPYCETYWNAEIFTACWSR